MSFGDVEWWVEDWIPAKSVVLVWGKESVGKTVLCWYLAKAIGEGSQFFGSPARRGRVLFIQFDMPAHYTQKRLKDLEFTDEVKFLLQPEVTSFESSVLLARFEQAAAWQPNVVFIDTLRKSHPFDDKLSETPSKVYGTYKELFPEATLVFIHHERKSHSDDARPSGESYSGSRAWSNDCQIGFHVFEDRRKKFPIVVRNARNQIGEKDWVKYFHLDHGWLLTSENITEQVMVLMKKHEGSDLVKAVEKELGCSQASAYRYIQKTREERCLGID